MNTTMKQSLITACAAACAMLSLGPALRAQGTDLVPHPSPDGFAAAAQQARAQLAPDAVLVLVGAVGHSTYNAGGNTVQLQFDLATGTSTAWIYAFYSPSKNERMILAAVDIPGVGYQVMPATSPVPIPDIHEMVDMTLSYAGSAGMVKKLAADSAYARYRSAFPNAYPQVLAYRPLSGADSALLPAWFPRTAPVWALRFTGGGDSAMVCYVSGGNGATWCARGAVAAVPVRTSRTLEKPDLSSTETVPAGGH